MSRQQRDDEGHTVGRHELFSMGVNGHEAREDGCDVPSDASRLLVGRIRPHQQGDEARFRDGIAVLGAEASCSTSHAIASATIVSDLRLSSRMLQYSGMATATSPAAADIVVAQSAAVLQSPGPNRPHAHAASSTIVADTNRESQYEACDP